MRSAPKTDPSKAGAPSEPAAPTLEDKEDLKAAAAKIKAYQLFAKKK